MEYDEAFGPFPPRSRRVPNREWEDPMSWVDLLLDAPRQAAINVAQNGQIEQQILMAEAAA